MTDKPEERDEAFARAITDSLDKSLDGIDDLSRLRLQHARAKALRPNKHGHKWIALAVAASFAALLLTPIFWQSQEEVDADVVAALEIPPSAEELDDLDMLLALEDGDA